MIKVRRAVIGFALLSTFYWMFVAQLWNLVTMLSHPYWIVAVASTLPAMLYAALALWFCIRLARSAARQAIALEQAKASE